MVIIYFWEITVVWLCYILCFVINGSMEKMRVQNHSYWK
jgi:hypothetical protein